MWKNQHRGELQVSDYRLVSEITGSTYTNQPLAFMKLFYKSFFLFLRILQNIAKTSRFLCEFNFSRQAMIFARGKYVLYFLTLSYL